MPGPAAATTQIAVDLLRCTSRQPWARSRNRAPHTLPSHVVRTLTHSWFIDSLDYQLSLGGCSLPEDSGHGRIVVDGGPLEDTLASDCSGADTTQGN
jgi:hypothetical protein